MRRRICVFGAGAVGGHLAARLAAAGHEVSAVARGAHLEALRSHGVALRHGDETIRGPVAASADPAALGTQDFVLVALKATALGDLADAAAPLLGPDTAVVFVQNGIPWWYAQGLAASRPPPPDLSPLDPGARLARAIAPERVIGAVAYSANEVLAPGVVVNHTPGRNMLTVGEADDRDSPRIRELRALLVASGMASPPCADIRQAVWAKLVLNLGSSSICLLAGTTIAQMMGDPVLAALRARVTAEGRAIAAAHGVASEGAPARPGGGHVSGAIAHKPSMLQDFERGRPLEVDAQLAMPLAFARAAGVATPVLDALVPLCLAKARGVAP